MGEIPESTCADPGVAVNRAPRQRILPSFSSNLHLRFIVE